MGSVERSGAVVLVVLALVGSEKLGVCGSRLTAPGLAVWPMNVVVGVRYDLFGFAESVMLSSPSNRFYLAVQSEPAGDPQGAEVFCWLALVDQLVESNKTLLWRAPCDREKQRTSDALQLCYFGLSSAGDLELSLQANETSAPAFSSNTSGLGVQSAVVSDSGAILLRTAANVTVWNSSSDQNRTPQCLGPYAPVIPAPAPTATSSSSPPPPPSGLGFFYSPPPPMAPGSPSSGTITRASPIALAKATVLSSALLLCGVL